MSRIPKTVTINAIVDQTKLAEVALWARDLGLPFLSRSELLRTVLELFHGQLLRNNKLPARVSLEEARDVLEALGMRFLGKNKVRLSEYEEAFNTESFISGVDLVRTQKAIELAQKTYERPVKLDDETKAMLLDGAIDDEE